MEEQKNELVHEGKTYSFVPIDVAIINSELVDYPIFLPLFENRLVKVNYDTEKLKEVLPRYKSKGVSSILLEKDDYYLFLAAVKGKMSEKIKGQDTFEGKMEIAQNEFNLLKENIIQVGISPYSIERTEEISSEVFDAIKKEKDIRDQMGQFKKMCQSEFQKNLSITFVAYGMLKTFSWCDDTIIKNVITGIILSDVTLSKGDFEILNLHEVNSLPAKILNHPVDVARMLEKSKAMMSPDTIKVIEEHHETPNGKGFPKGLSADQISFIATIHILARYFVDSFIEQDFNLGEKVNILGAVHKIYYKGNFRRACTALFDVLDMPMPQS